MAYIVKVSFKRGIVISQIMSKHELDTIHLMLDESIDSFLVDDTPTTWNTGERSEAVDLESIDQALWLWRKGKKIEAITRIRYMFNTSACAADFIKSSFICWQMGDKIHRINYWWARKVQNA